MRSSRTPSVCQCLNSPAWTATCNPSDRCPAGVNPLFRQPRTNTGLGDFPGGDILVTMGGFNDLDGLPVGTPFMQAATLMHEFGHNAERRHGGEAFEPNCRPTYLSVMNYMYQLRGLLDDDGEPNLGFSQEVGAALSETEPEPAQRRVQAVPARMVRAARRQLSRRPARSTGRAVALQRIASAPWRRGHGAHRRARSRR